MQRIGMAGWLFAAVSLFYGCCACKPTPKTVTTPSVIYMQPPQVIFEPKTNWIPINGGQGWIVPN